MAKTADRALPLLLQRAVSAKAKRKEDRVMDFMALGVSESE